MATYNHSWEIFQTVPAAVPKNPGGASGSGNAASWAAVVVDNVTGKFVVKSELSTTRNAAKADAEVKYTAWKRQHGGA